MALLEILRWPDPRLSTPCTPVTSDAAMGEVAALAADMLETMYAAPGRGLAAPQVGALLRMFVMDTTWKDGVRDPKVILNPELLWRSDEVKIGPEGCLSIPGISTDISRSQDIRMRWTDLSGAVHEETLTGFAAICAQHEYDHLDGIVTLDRLSPEARAQAEAALA